MRRSPGCFARTIVLMMVTVLCGVAESRAQSAVGTGPLTGQLADTEPVSGVLRVGRVRLAPGVTVREIGWNDNIFDEPADTPPKEDYIFSVQPDISVFTRLRLIRLSAYAGSDLTYFKTYESENYAGYSARGRVDFLLSRLRPFVGGGEFKTRLPANGEVSVRANRKEQELSSGLAFDLSDHSLVYASYVTTKNLYEKAFQDGVDISDTLTRNRDDYQTGLKTDITPLLSLQLWGSYQLDTFPKAPLRNAESWLGIAQFKFAPQAVVTGTATLGYRDLNADDPHVRPYRGFEGNAALTYPFLELGHFNISASRSLEYSFDDAEAYYVETGGILSYTQRIGGQWDAQVRGSWSQYEYSAVDVTPAHTDTLESAGGSLGYNLRNRSRVAANYEYSRRRSPALPLRNYERRRVFLSWLFAF